MWKPEKEKEFIKTTDTIIYAVVSCSKCDFNYEAVFRKKKPRRCPECGGKLRSSTPQGRNKPISDYTEKFALEVIDETLKETGFDNLEVKREVICEELDLTFRSAADLAIVKKGRDSRIYKPQEIVIVFEVKMSLVWNWEINDEGEIELIADYDGHKGRGSIYRSDSILKAIGKGAIFRSHFQSSNIPYIVVGNCPPPSGYFNKIDGSVKAGIVQKFISLNSNPVVINKSNFEERNPKQTKEGGYLRLDSKEELKEFLVEFLNEERVFIGSMLKKRKLGEIIASINSNKDYSEIGTEFFKKLYEVN